MRAAQRNIFPFWQQVLALVVGVFFVASPFTAAAIPAAAVGVGGISPYATTDYVKGVYGEPSYQTILKESGELLYTYGTSTLIFFSTEKRLNSIVKGKDEGSDELFVVRRIDTQQGSGLTTPAGIGIGDVEKKIADAYGKPDVRVIAAEEFDTRLMYVGEAKAEDEGLCFMTFYIKDGKIAKISCYATRH